MKNMKKVLITGADGFIGSHLTEELVAQGYDVTALVYYNSFNSKGWLDHTEVLDKVNVISGDVRDTFCVKNAMVGCDIVYHLAALIGIPYSYNAPESYIQTNVIGTLNVLQAARELGGVKVVQTSTSEVYGTAMSIPITEQHQLQGQSPYSASKIGADHLAMSYYLSFDMPVSIIRPFNTYGPRQSNRAVIPTIISQIVNGERTIKLGSITPTRDFNFVKDTVDGFIAIGGSEKAIGETINIGTGFDISIGDTVKLIAEIMDVKVNIESDEKRIRPEQSEVLRLCASNKKAYELTGWAPEYSGFEGLKSGLIETINWFSDSKNISHYSSNNYIV